MAGCFAWTQAGWQSLHTTFFNKRYDAASSLVGGDWLVTGGLDPDNQFSSVLLYRSDTWLEYESMPISLEKHCQVTVGADVFVIGGYSESSYQAVSLVYKLSDGIW